MENYMENNRILKKLRLDPLFFLKKILNLGKKTKGVPFVFLAEMPKLILPKYAETEIRQVAEFRRRNFGIAEIRYTSKKY